MTCPVPSRFRSENVATTQRRLSEKCCAGGWIGTRHDSDFGPDYRWNSWSLTSFTVTRVRCHTRSACRRGGKPANTGQPHPSRQSFGTTRRVRLSGSHLGSTLNPGGAVLTRGVFRRSGSVACIRVDASPNEVLTQTMMPERSDMVKHSGPIFPDFYGFLTVRPGPRACRWCR